MYYHVGIKCDTDPYSLEYLDFDFETFEEFIDFIKHIMNVSDYEMSIFKRYE